MDITETLENSALPKEAIFEIVNKFVPLIIDEREYFIKYGERMNKIGIIYKGTLVSRYSNKEGKEVASKFYYQQGDNLVVDYNSFKNNLPSEEEIQAIEKSTLLTLTFNDYKYLINKFPALQASIAKLAEDSYIKALQRIRDFQLLNNKERIENFHSTHEQIVGKLMVKDKASYLGMSRNIYTNNIIKK